MTKSTSQKNFFREASISTPTLCFQLVNPSLLVREILKPFGKSNRLYQMQLLYHRLLVFFKEQQRMKTLIYILVYPLPFFLYFLMMLRYGFTVL